MKKAKAKSPHRDQSRAPKTNSRRWYLLIGISILALALALVIQRVEFRPPQPPVVSTAALDPLLRNTITTSYTAVARSPKSGAAWGQLGQALHAAEFNPEARLCYSNALARDQKNFRWPYLLGLLELQDQPEAAIAHLEQAATLAADKIDSPRFQLARALVERGEYEKAEPQLRLLLAAHPAHAPARLELARIYLARGALKGATQELQPAMTNSHTMRVAFLLAVQIAQRNGQTNVAAQLSRRASSMPRGFDWPDPVLRDIKNMRADRAGLADQVNSLLQQQRLPEADIAANKLLSLFPEDPEGLLLLGRLRYVQKRCPEAEAAYRKLLQSQPNSLNGLIQLGLSLMCQQRWTNAAQALEKAIALKPDFAQAHSNLAVARSRAGDGKGAIRAYRDALRCAPGDINAHMGLAEELANAGQVDEARKHVESAAALNPNDSRLQKAREQLGIK